MTHGCFSNNDSKIDFTSSGSFEDMPALLAVKDSHTVFEIYIQIFVIQNIVTFLKHNDTDFLFSMPPPVSPFELENC